jgi:hypothetical protein
MTISARKTPAKAVLDVLALLGEVEWARCVGNEAPPRKEPPFVAWRFKEPDDGTEARIVEAVKAYSGGMKWVIKKGERNWVIEPAVFESFARKFRVDIEALRSFGVEFPFETDKALTDIVRLAEHLRNRLVPR